MPLTIVRQDIVQMQVDAVVNAANPELKMGGGVSGALFVAAGTDELQAACDELAPIAIGEAAITPGFGLPAKFVIHAAGPVYDPERPDRSEALLRAAYANALRLAIENGCKSIAFPLISSGLFRYPKEAALRIARDTIRRFLADHDLNVFLVVYDRESFGVARALLGAVEAHIDERYVAGQGERRRIEDERRRRYIPRARRPDVHTLAVYHLHQTIPKKLDDWIGKREETFSQALLRLIDERGLDDVEVYKRANVDRKLFSKIRTNRRYRPSKRTAVAFVLALELDLEEAADLLARAGYALSRSEKFDLIVEYFILNRHYDIFAINEVLFQYDQPQLGAETG